MKQYGACEEVEAIRQDEQEGRNLYIQAVISMNYNLSVFNVSLLLLSVLPLLLCLVLHEICIIMSCVVHEDISALTTDYVSVVDSSIDPEKTHNTEPTALTSMNDSQHENYSELAQVSISEI